MKGYFVVAGYMGCVGAEDGPSPDESDYMAPFE